MSPLERSEKDCALQSRNSAEKDLVLPKRNSGSETRAIQAPYFSEPYPGVANHFHSEKWGKLSVNLSHPEPLQPAESFPSQQEPWTLERLFPFASNVL